MSDYSAPLRDVRFVLEHIVPLRDLTALPAFAHADADLVDGLLEEAGRFAATAVAPTNRDGDTIGAQLVDGEVRTPDSFRAAYAKYVDAGWGAVQHPMEYGGGGFPLTVAMAVKEFITSANMALSLCPMLTTGAVHLMKHHCSDEQRATYLPRMISGEWTGTMNLTEPQAGSDVGAVTTKAEPVGDGTYRITGQKIYITFGDHDLTENVIHLVLARLPDSPPGTKGISLFIVPKFLVGPDGSIGDRNDVGVVSIEHKLGIHGSPTCVMEFGANGGAIGELVGAPNEGMRQMFTMMNDARLGVGLEGLAIAERAYQQALAYAQVRQQGRRPETPPGQQAPIVEHPDVRRMLLTMRANIEAMRALCYLNASALDHAAAGADPDAREHNERLADLLTPLSKAWSTDLGVELTSLAVQVYGGMGYVEEGGVAQHFRDSRIAPIYEGTNGIQALDLVHRKLGMAASDGTPFVEVVLRGFRDELDGMPAALSDITDALRDGLDVAERTTAWLIAARGRTDDVSAGATPYLRLLATVVGAALLARGAAAAQCALDGADGAATEPATRDFLAARIVVARFFATQILPTVRGLEPSVTAGDADLRALSVEQFAP